MTMTKDRTMNDSVEEVENLTAEQQQALLE